MESSSELFFSVFTRLIESFTPHFHVLSAQYDKSLQNKNNKISLSALFEDFCKNTPLYSDTINSVCSLAKNNVSKYLKTLIEIYANTLILQDPGIFSILLTHTAAVYHSSSSAHDICNYLALYITTDIIEAIVIKYSTADQGSAIAKCAYKICDPSVTMEIHKYIINVWSNILAITSIKSFQESSAPFMAYVDSVNDELLFSLISKIRLDSCKSLSCQFLDEIVIALKILQKLRKLTNSIFSDVSTLITSVNFSYDALQKIFDIAWSEKDEANTKDGAFELIVTLFQHLPNKESEANRFYQKRVYMHVGDDKKTERDLKLFWRRVMGGYNSLTTEDDLSFIGTTGPNAKEMPSVFMNVYFKKANFSICPSLFRNVLVHLASLNFIYFLHEMLPSFLILPITDYRIVVLLSTIELFNADNFRKHAVSKIEKDDIDALNALVRGKVCQNLNILAQNDKKSIAWKFLEVYWRKIDQYDNKVAMFFDQNEICNFKISKILFEMCKENEFYSLEVQLLRSLPYILDNGDYLENGVFSRIIECCNSSKLQTNLAAFDVAKYIANKPELQVQFAEALIKEINKTLTQETLFMALKLFSLIVSSSTKSFSADLLHDIEFYAFIGFVSNQPSTRIISMTILDRLDDLLEHKGISFYIHQNVTQMEKLVKTSLFGNSIRNDEILFQWVMASRYFDLWLLYITEFVEIILAANYTPLLQRFSDNIYSYLVEENEKKDSNFISLYILYFASRINQDTYLKCQQSYKISLYEARQATIVPTASTLNLISKLINNRNTSSDKLAFAVIKHIHISFAGDIADILSQCTQEQITDASCAFLNLLESPHCDENIINTIRNSSLNLLTAMHSALVKMNASSPRTIIWNNDLEKNVIDNSILAENYCVLITKIVTRNILENDWSVPAREIILRCLLNWAKTTSSELENLRLKTMNALATLARAGPMISDPNIFDKSVCDIFGEIEYSGNRVLNSVLFYHIDLILTHFCDACLTMSRTYADLFFDSLFVVFTTGTDFCPSFIGCLLLVGLVYEEIQHPRAQEFMEAFTSSVYDGFGGAAEVVFSEAFRILSLENSHMPVKEIINALRNFVPEIRLIPKQATCTVDSPEKFRFYTPYQFLENLMKATEKINEDYSTSFFLLWQDLLENVNHEDIVPLFIMQWNNSQIKKRLLLWLIRQDAPFISEKLVSRCSFAYFIHITLQDLNFENELWVVELLTNAFERRFGSFSNIVPLLNFSFLFYKIPQTQPLLQALCKQFDVPPPSSSHDDDLLVTVVNFVSKLVDDDPESIEQWGTEALKWLFGCNDLKFASLSLKIYNVLQKPLDNNVITGILKIIDYYVPEMSDDPLSLTDLLSDSFRFFSNIFNGNEQLAFNYASAFIDCTAFPDSCRAVSTDIFLKSLNNQTTNKSAWIILPSIVRPLLSRIETDDRSRQILEILTKTSSSQELMMIAAPLKEAFGGFVCCQPTDTLLELADETTLCRTIVHYSLMIESASEQLAAPIFRIASLIVNKVTNENVRESYAILYKTALNMLGVVPSAMQFVLALAEHDPAAVTKSGFAYLDWERSIDDVERALSRLINPQPIPRSSSIPTLSDTMTLNAIISFIGAPVIPKVIPYCMQQDLIEGMKKVTKGGRKIRRVSSNYIKKSESTFIKLQKFNAGNWELKVLEPPTVLLSNLPPPVYNDNLLMNYIEFDAAYSL